MLKWVYVLAAAVGFALPWSFFVAFLLENGPDVGVFLEDLFANHVSRFFAVDLIVTAAVFLVYLWGRDRQRPGSRWWLLAAATIAIGPSFSLPLYLYLRERQ